MKNFKKILVLLILVVIFIGTYKVFLPKYKEYQDKRNRVILDEEQILSLEEDFYNVYKETGSLKAVYKLYNKHKEASKNKSLELNLEAFMLGLKAELMEDESFNKSLKEGQDYLVKNELSYCKDNFIDGVRSHKDKELLKEILDRGFFIESPKTQARLNIDYRYLAKSIHEDFSVFENKIIKAISEYDLESQDGKKQVLIDIAKLEKLDNEEERISFRYDLFFIDDIEKEKIEEDTLGFYKDVIKDLPKDSQVFKAVEKFISGVENSKLKKENFDFIKGIINPNTADKITNFDFIYAD